MSSFSPTPSAVRAPGSQPPTGSSGSPGHSIYMDSDTITTIVVVVAVFIAFMIAAQLYGRLYYWRRRRLPVTSAGNMAISNDAPPKHGLDKAVLDSLPTFKYRAPALPQEGGYVVSQLETQVGVVERYCAVCLIDFQENDACRLLPKCSHSFHTECIDAWFLSNTTCPLCRTNAEAEDSMNGSQHAEEVATVFLLHQGMEDHIQRSGAWTSDRLSPHGNGKGCEQRQDKGDQMPLPLSGSPCHGASLGGGAAPPQHVRRSRMLELTQSHSMNARYDLQGEGMSHSMVGEPIHRTGSVSILAAHHASETFDHRHPHLADWHRSLSEKSLNVRPVLLQFAGDGRLRGNCSHGDAHLGTDLQQGRGPSLSHVTIDLPQPLVERIPTPPSASSSPVQQASAEGIRPCVQSASVQHQPGGTTDRKRGRPDPG